MYDVLYELPATSVRSCRMSPRFLGSTKLHLLLSCIASVIGQHVEQDRSRQSLPGRSVLLQDTGVLISCPAMSQRQLYNASMVQADERLCHTPSVSAAWPMGQISPRQSKGSDVAFAFHDRAVYSFSELLFLRPMF